MKKIRYSPTLRDVAQVSGFSVNTVSRALRGKDDISESTASLIKKTAEELGYINNAPASSLRLGHTNTIAVILGDISNPHFSIMMKEIENRARLDGYSSFLINTNEDLNKEAEAIRTALNRNVDGIIICPSQQDDSNIRYLINMRIPFVQIGRYFNLPGASWIVCNDELGGYQAVRHLIEKGHRDILFLSGPPYVSSSRERQAGYCRALKEAKIKYRPALVKETSLTGCSETINDILREKLKFSAIFAFSDMLAWDAWACFQKAGYRIPRDFSLVGFDYIQSRFSIPFRLATISSYKARISTTAVECLLCIIKNEQDLHKECDGLCHKIIDTELIEGDTVLAFNGYKPKPIL